jgi:hypothetical protein
MNRKPECVELQSRMVEYFSEPTEVLPQEIERHIESCPDCQLEFKQMQQTLHLIQDAAKLPEEVPEQLLEQIEAKLDTVKQLKPEYAQSNKARNILILQYSYLASMAVIIWLTLLLTQPIFNSWLAINEFACSMPVLEDYSLFIAFFIAGGIFALISSPLIIKTSDRQTLSKKKSGFFRRIFSSGLRLFAC